jgi:hypothetical protein
MVKVISLIHNFIVITYFSGLPVNSKLTSCLRNITLHLQNILSPNKINSTGDSVSMSTFQFQKIVDSIILI